MNDLVLGVDPGTAATGYGVVAAGSGPQDRRLVECGVVLTEPDDALDTRLGTIYEGVVDVIERHRPTALAVEGVFYGKNAKSLIKLAHARGVILLAGARAGIEVCEFTPAVVKKTIVGGGGATKEQIGYMVQKLLHLSAPPEPADAADGVALALTYLMKRVPV